MTLPPRPPSPPSGPPIGVRHSGRNEVQPDPPVPPSTRITTRSMNTYCLMGKIWVLRNWSGVLKRGADSAPALSLELFDVANPSGGKDCPGRRRPESAEKGSAS